MIFISILLTGLFFKCYKKDSYPIHIIYHRFIHIKALYKYIHSVHHRNTDIEPFAGMSMHPVEHLYYFTSVGPSLFLFASPFAFMFNAIHLCISPAGGHSGWEDHMQANQFHYLHHRFFMDYII